jgi:hypothetical protein
MGPVSFIATNGQRYNPFFVGAFSITPADSDFTVSATNPQGLAAGLYVDGAGTVIVTMQDGTGPFTFTVAAGTFLPLVVKRVAAASTATGILGGLAK